MHCGLDSLSLEVEPVCGKKLAIPKCVCMLCVCDSPFLEIQASALLQPPCPSCRKKCPSYCHTWQQVHGLTFKVHGGGDLLPQLRAEAEDSSSTGAELTIEKG